MNYSKLCMIHIELKSFLSNLCFAKDFLNMDQGRGSIHREKNLFLLDQILEYWSFKCFYAHFLDHTVYLFIFRFFFSKIFSFSPYRFENLGIIWCIYLKIRENFTNSTYNRMNTYNRKLRVLT